MTTYKCKANNRNTCRYHGSIHVHNKQLTDARENYLEVMREHLKSWKKTHEELATEKIVINKATDAVKDAQAVVDSHDSNFDKITSHLDDLEYAGEGEDPESFDTEYVEELANMRARVQRAEAVRRSRANEDNPHGLAYVAEAPHSLKVAKAACKQIEIGEFTGVIASEDQFSGEETMIVVGSDGYYKTTTKGEIYATGTLFKVGGEDAPQAPLVIRANPAIEGPNLRWKNDWKSTVSPQSGQRVNEQLGYIVYNDTTEYKINMAGVVRSKSGLLSLQ